MTDIVVEITENNTQVTVSAPDVIVVTDMLPAASAAASAAAAAAAVTAVLASIGTALAAGTYPASFTTLTASDNVVIAATKKLYLDGVAGVGGDSYIVESAANVVDHYAGGVKALSLTANGAALVAGTVAAPSLSFGTDTGSGLYRIGANNIGLAISGAKVLDLASTGLSITGTFSASGNVAIDTTTLFVDAANNRVGIGTAAPSTPLHVVDGTGFLKFQNVSQANLLVSGVNSTIIVDSVSSAYPAYFLKTQGTMNGGIVGLGVAASGVALTNSSGTGIAITSAGNVVVGATQKLYLDGAAHVGGNTYLVESSADVLDMYAGGTRAIRAGSTGVSVNGGSLTDNDGNIALGALVGASNKGGLFVTDNFAQGSNYGYISSYLTNFTTGAYAAYRRGIYSGVLAPTGVNLQDFRQCAIQAAVNGGLSNRLGIVSTFNTINETNAGTSYAYTSYNYLQDGASQAVVTAFVGFYSRGQWAVGTPLVTNHYDLWAATYAGVGGTITNRYAVYIDYSTTGIANPWGIYQSQSGVKNYFAGSVAVGATSKLYLDGVAGAGGDSYIVESSANVLDIYAGGAKTLSLATTGATITGTLSTTDPAGGAGPAWKLGVAASVSPTAPDRTLRVDVGGTSYYLAAKTTND